MLLLLLLLPFVVAFGAPVDISNTAGSNSNSINPRLYTDSKNTVHVVWQECSGPPDIPCPNGCWCNTEEGGLCERRSAPYCLVNCTVPLCRKDGVEGKCCKSMPTPTPCPSPTPIPCNNNGMCDPGEDPIRCPDACTNIYCGDGACQFFENPWTCPQDCPMPTPCPSALCGNCACEPGEDYTNCPDDCPWPGCGNGVCQAPQENSCNCPDDCSCVPNCGDGTCQSPPENRVNCPSDCLLSFYASISNGLSWQGKGVLSYGLGYEAKALPLGGVGGEVSVLLSQIGPKAHIDAIALDVGGALIAPDDAYFNDGYRESVLRKVRARDYDVTEATNRSIIAVWRDVPVGEAALVLTAREESQEELTELGGSPFYYPRTGTSEEGFVPYTVGERKALVAFLRPISGHPDGMVYFEIWSEGGMLRVSLDVTPDNTRDVDDWAEVSVISKDGEKIFRITGARRSTYGSADFKYTDKVLWEHRTYEFTIPLDEVGAKVGDALYLRFGVYGTILEEPGPPHIECPPGRNWEIFYVNNTGGRWGTPIDITNTTSNSIQPRIVIDSNDRIYVVWSEWVQAQAQWNPWYARSADGGKTWSAAAQVTDVGISSTYYELGVDGSDRVGLIFIDGNGKTSFTSYTGVSQLWDAAVNIDNLPGGNHPRLAPSKSGGFHFVWDRGMEIWYRLTPAGALVDVSNTKGGSEKPDVAVDSSNVAHIVWREANDTSGSFPGDWEIWYAKVRGGAVQDVQDISNTPNHDSNRPRIDVDASDRPHVVWMDSAAGNYDILYSTSSDGGVTFAAWTNIANNNGFSFLPVVRADGNDNLHVLWGDDTPVNNEIYWNGWKGAWQGAADVSNTHSNSYAHDLRLDGRNSVHVVFEDNLPGAYDIYYLQDEGFGPNMTKALKLTVGGANCTNQSVSFSVRDQAGSPVQSATVTVYFYNTSTFGWDLAASLVTDANGDASYTPAQAGNYKAIANKVGYPLQTKFFTIADCPEPGATPTPTPSPTPRPCGTDEDCASYESCENGFCVPITGTCGYAVNHTWVKYECCFASDCPASMTCSDHSCVNVGCPCGEIVNHVCQPYECCSDAECAGGELCIGNACRLLPPTIVVLVPKDPKLPRLLVDAPGEVAQGERFNVTAQDERGGPTANVIVQVFNRTFVTDENGTVTILAEAPGEHTMTISKSGYGEMERNLLVLALPLGGLLQWLLQFWWAALLLVCGVGVVAAALVLGTFVLRPKKGV